MVKIGLDLDNTIACYDAVFARVAAGEGIAGLDLAGAAGAKRAVKEHFVGSGRGEVWTQVQGRVYGPLMDQARPFPGALDFFRGASAAGVVLSVVSHRTRAPVRGPAFDLHRAARDWLDREGFLGVAGVEVFLEETRAAKIERVRRTGCTAFVDDLAEVLADPSFPPGVRRVLFDPSAPPVPAGPGGGGLEVARDWAGLAAILLSETRE